MARSRSLPSNLFDEPDFFERSSDTQVILLGLVLGADDAGRGSAHLGLLARKLNKVVSLIEQALDELETCGLLHCYQVEHYHYYQLTRWHEWETLSKPTPSKFPAPPPRASQKSPGDSEIPQGISGQSGNIPSEGEEEGEWEEEEKRSEGEEEGIPPNVVAFPLAHSDNVPAVAQRTQEATLTVAAILSLSVTPALVRLVEEYLDDASLSLFGEADAAREWIDDRQRNRKGQRMTPAFFRRWLKREHDDTLRRHTQQTLAQATGTHGTQRSSAPAPPALPRSLMHLEETYRAAHIKVNSQEVPT